MTWLLGLWQSFYKWLALAGAAVLAIGAALLYGREKGKQAVEQKDAAQHGQDIAKAAEKRNEVEDKVDQLPSAAPSGDPNKPVRVGDAPPGSAGGILRDDGWTR